MLKPRLSNSKLVCHEMRIRFLSRVTVTSRRRTTVGVTAGIREVAIIAHLSCALSVHDIVVDVDVAHSMLQPRFVSPPPPAPALVSMFHSTNCALSAVIAVVPVELMAASTTASRGTLVTVTIGFVPFWPGWLWELAIAVARRGVV